MREPVASYNGSHETDDVGRSFAYDLYVCDRCGLIAREHGLSRAGITWLTLDDKVSWEPENSLPNGEGGFQ